MQNYTALTRTFGPIYNHNSKVLILGSFPSVKSREVNFFYGHPKNRFWPVLSKVFDCDTPTDIGSKREFAISHNIALWDVIESCEIIGSSDSSIRNVVPVAINEILSAANIRAIFCNGTTSYNLYCKYLEPISGIPAIKLPSTSPANAAWSMDRLYNEWVQIREYV